MATDTPQKQTDTTPAEAPKAAAPAKAATPAKPAQAKRKPASRAKTASKSRTRSTASSASRSRTTSRSRTRKPAARTTRTETATATAPRTQAKALNGGQEFVAGLIEAQERSVTAFVDYQTRAAELSRIPGATAIAGAQAQVLRGVTDAYVSAARALLR
jgi:hypothetical protein